VSQIQTKWIANNAVTNAKLAQAPTLTLKGNNTGGTANVLDLTVAQVNAILPVFTSSLNGLAPLSGGGTTNFLRADGTWAAPTGSGGTVTSVAFSDASTTPIYAITGSPVTTSGTLTQTLTTQSANTVFAGPTTGSAAQPAFRALVSADVATLTVANITATSNSTLTTLSALSLPYSQITGAPTAAANNKETFTLSGADITNQFVTLAFTPLASSTSFLVSGGGDQLEGSALDYVVSGAQIQFKNGLATGGVSALVAGDIIQIQYEH
jgi:hypothetical protein